MLRLGERTGPCSRGYILYKLQSKPLVSPLIIRVIYSLLRTSDYSSYEGAGVRGEEVWEVWDTSAQVLMTSPYFALSSCLYEL